MIPRIDFFSYTVDNPAPHFQGFELFEGLNRQFYYDCVAMLDVNTDPPTDTWTPVKPNTPYRKAVQNPETKMRLEWGNVDTIFIQLTGQTCEYLRNLGRLDAVIERYQQDCTRIDYAVDMLCDTTPADFVNARSHKKFRSISFFSDSSGDTAYVGSWSSDRFARVYRYNPPHERSQWLRSEFVLKGKRARAGALAYCKGDIDGTVRNLGTTWGWNHPSWKPDNDALSSEELLKVWRPDRHASKTLKWLEGQCAPALVKLVLNGEIANLGDWLIENVYSKLSNRDDGAAAVVSIPQEEW